LLLVPKLWSLAPCSMDQSAIDAVLDKLARDVESSIHAFYRGDVRQHTQRIKTDTFLREARAALAPLLGTGGAAPAASSAGSPLSPDEITAATRCVMAWMPMGSPTTALPESRCISGAKEMAPTWGEREKARAALKHLTG
jgi:hypothetical protein